MWEAIFDAFGVDPVLREYWPKVRLAFRQPEILWLGLIVLPFAAWWIVHRHLASVGATSLAMRRTLSLLRVAVLAAVFLILATPYLTLDADVEQKPTLAVLVDHSRSMELPVGATADGVVNAALADPARRPESSPPTADQKRAVAGKKRVELAHAALARLGANVLPTLAEKFDVRVLGVGIDVQPLAADWQTAVRASPPKTLAGRSRLGDAVGKLVEESAGRPMAGIVLLSDGQNTAGASLAQAAFAARRAKAPIFGVPTGGDARLKDVAVAELFGPGTASKGDAPRIAVTIESHGFDGQSVDVVLKEGDVELDRKPLQLSGAEQQHLDFAYNADRTGLHVLAVEIEPKSDETLVVNNRARTALRVVDEKLKVLLVDGSPRWDLRFLRNAMANDRGVVTDTVLETELDRVPKNPPLPETAAGYDEYAAVVLGDASPKLLTDARQRALVEAVRTHGLGLVVAAGPRAMPHLYRNQALEPLLPVVAEQAPGRLAAAHEAYGLEIAVAGRSSELVRLYDDAERNASQWSGLPGYFWCAAVQRAKPGAAAYLVNPKLVGDYGPTPIVASQQAGEGTVLFVGTDSTALWRQNVGDRYFYKFWGQALRFVARRPGAKDKARLEVAPLQAQPGEDVTLTLTAPDDLPTAEIEVAGEDPLAAPATKATLARDPDYRGPMHRYVGSTRLSQEGVYRATYANGEASVDFAVVAGVEEFQHPEVDRDALETAARGSGGRLLEIHELDELSKLAAAATVRRIRRQQDLWDRWLVLVLVAGLYCLDVGIRRWAGLA